VNIPAGVQWRSPDSLPALMALRRTNLSPARLFVGKHSTVKG
jgi:hypothetical protein